MIETDGYRYRRRQSAYNAATLVDPKRLERYTWFNGRQAKCEPPLEGLAICNCRFENRDPRIAIAFSKESSLDHVDFAPVLTCYYLVCGSDASDSLLDVEHSLA